MSLKADKNNAKIEITKIDLDLPAVVEAELEAVGMNKQSLIEMVKDSIDTNQFANEIGTLDDDVNIVSLTSTTLVLADNEGEEIKFTRK